jgi:HD-GYP domain-containing protein (c-di-GMP phosphodiesterase class II)
MPHATAAMDAVQFNLDRLMDDLRQGRELNLAQLNRGVEAMVDSITRNPAAIGWLREIRRADHYGYHHALACSVWAASFGRHLGLEREDLREFALAGLLFDVGKARLPPALLAKEGALDADEQAMVRQHVEIGLDMLRGTPGVTPRILGMVATHHERHDGSGYPAGLAGFRIPMGGRILGLVDTYDALTSVRSHASALSPHEAVSELYQMRGTAFQSELVEQFIQTCGIYPTGSLVELSDGRVGVVTSVHTLKRLRPSVMLLLDADHRPLPDFVTLDLGQAAGDNGPEADNGQGLMIRRGLPAGAFGIDPSELFLD